MDAVAVGQSGRGDGRDIFQIKVEPGWLQSQIETGIGVSVLKAVARETEFLRDSGWRATGRAEIAQSGRDLVLVELPAYADALLDVLGVDSLASPEVVKHSLNQRRVSRPGRQLDCNRVSCG